MKTTSKYYSHFLKLLESLFLNLISAFFSAFLVFLVLGISKLFNLVFATDVFKVAFILAGIICFFYIRRRFRIFYGRTKIELDELARELIVLLKKFLEKLRRKL